MQYKINWPRTILLVVVFLAVVFGIVFGIWKLFHRGGKIPEEQKMSLSSAAKEGEKTAHKLMIQIEKNKCPEDQKNSCYDRGDIVLIMSGDHQFSAAEKSGFLIVKMDLTDKQAELLTQSLDRITGRDEETGEDQTETLQRRRFAVNLEKLGISDEDYKGKEIEDKSFEWKDVIVEK